MEQVGSAVCCKESCICETGVGTKGKSFIQGPCNLSELWTPRVKDHPLAQACGSYRARKGRVSFL